jgi:hypothetical protein
MRSQPPSDTTEPNIITLRYQPRCQDSPITKDYIENVLDIHDLDFINQFAIDLSNTDEPIMMTSQ